ncbi:uncharacterized protein LOC131679667 [Topomyia yanbarensis]|uniref:uncharacterized protein LOC131679667 n=1 Tax=Topomyia yanbarensis TaxID=2498891 RepID=UPI00273ACC3F|nr:uncharacterized protein LOC131679667 [Topomyia yanbarensis]
MLRIMAISLLRCYIISILINFASTQLKSCATTEICVPVRKCAIYKEYVDQALRKWPANLQKLAKDNLCKRQKVDVTTVYSVCCPKLTNHKECGILGIDRIVNGEVAAVFEFPWMVLLQAGSGKFVCGGTLISRRYVLTAAHCIKNASPITSVRLGENDINSPIDCNIIDNEKECAPPPQDIRVEENIRHPQHSNRWKKNDIALLRLERAVEFSHSVRPICLPNETPEQQMIDPPYFIVSGWGLTENGSSFDRLRFARLPPVSLESCATSVRSLNTILKLDKSQICAGGVDRVDNCSGDSGGPLQYIANITSRVFQLGVVSFGVNSCGSQSQPGVYTNVLYYMNWIHENVDDKMPSRGIQLLLLGIVCVSSALALTRCVGQKQCVDFATCNDFKTIAGKPSSSWSPAVRVQVQSRLCKVEQRGNIKVYSVCCNVATQDSNRSKALALLDLNSCGKISADKIAFGKTARLFDFPWMALLLDFDRTISCGGTLIATSYVLTAAHCDRKVEYVRLGEFNVSKRIDCSDDGKDCADPPQEIQVAKFIKHPLYSSSKRKNDIALVKLAKPAVLSFSVKTICLPIGSMVKNPEPTHMFVTGWGLTERGTTSKVLQYATLMLVPNSQCTSILARLSDAISLDQDSQICAKGQGKVDNCAGDSGGPLQYLSRQASAVQYGIVSFGVNSCGKQSAPGVYTKVAHYIEWILQNVQ